MWNAMDGYKRWIGVVIAIIGVAICVLEAWPVSPADIGGCLRELISPQTLAGIGIGVGTVGTAHAVEKAKLEKAKTPNA